MFFFRFPFAGKSAIIGDKSSLRKGGSEKMEKNTSKRRLLSLAKLFWEQLEWDHIDEELDALDQQHQQLENEMAEAASDYTKIAKLQKQLNEIQEKIDEKTARWEYLSTYVDE